MGPWGPVQVCPREKGQRVSIRDMYVNAQHGFLPSTGNPHARRQEDGTQTVADPHHEYHTAVKEEPAVGTPTNEDESQV